LRLRQVVLTDGPMLAEFFASLTPDDLRFRFLDSRTAPSAQEIAAMPKADHRRDEHLIAFDSSTGEVVASLMLLADPAMDSAEVAIAVAASRKHEGIGWALLRHAVDLAFVRGFRTLRCLEDRANHEAFEVEGTLGFRARELAAEPGLILLESTLA
jgi:acetyltransferase